MSGLAVSQDEGLSRRVANHQTLLSEALYLLERKRRVASTGDTPGVTCSCPKRTVSATILPNSGPNHLSRPIRHPSTTAPLILRESFVTTF